MGTEKFCLKWNDFESNISSAFREIRSDGELFDVTLATEDEEHLQAHKVILAACSGFFRNILKRSGSHQNLLLYLKGVSSRDMTSVLNFMYHGEVNVAQDSLNAFLAVAEELAVKGLTTESKNDETIRNSTAQSRLKCTTYVTIQSVDKNNAVPKDNISQDNEIKQWMNRLAMTRLNNHYDFRNKGQY